jgi:4-amino-4-deoxy-L-arabinose transferase-like glycosyltransferase
VIAYSRSSWNPNLMPFFSLSIFYALWLAVNKKRLKLLGLVGFLLGIAFQLHYLATFLVPIIGLYLLLFTSFKKSFKYYLLGIGGFVLGWSPFLIFELRHRFPNFRTLYRFIFFGKETGFVAANFWPTVSDIIFRLFNRLITNNQVFWAQMTLIFSLVVFFLFWFLFRKEKINQTFALFGFWLILGVGLFGFYQKEVYDYYLGFMFPLPFFFLGLALWFLSRSWRGKLVTGALIIALAVINLQGVPFRYQPNRQLAQVEQIAKIIFEEARGEPLNFALITGHNSDHAYRYFLEIWGTSPVVIENPQVDPERTTVTDQLFVVCEVSDCHPLGHPLWEIAGFGRAEIIDQWSAPGGIIITKLGHYLGK